jgi:glyoxylase-like metal-dependent hydrolase (beta-lactamase superfamily II)
MDYTLKESFFRRNNMHISNGVEMLELSANVLGGIQTIYPTLLSDQDMTVLVDTGFPGLTSQFIALMKEANIPFEHLNKIIITHHDIDHIGSLPAILDTAAQEIEVMASNLEKPFIQGEKRILKLTPEAIEQVKTLIPVEVPEERRRAIISVFENPPKANVDRIVMDGEEIPYCGGIVVIETPGHTPGHISLYHKPSKTLIAGDALQVIDGKLTGPKYNHNDPKAFESLKKFAEYDIDAVICYHGGLYNQNDINQTILMLANEE